MRVSVAIILRDTASGDDTEVLLMQRAKHDQDPWSGQMSFPGGKIESDDESSKAAAAREAFEEVGIELRSEDYVGQLDDILGFKVNGVHAVHITPHIFKPTNEIKLRTNHEVADTVWLPLSWLNDPNKAHHFFSPHDETVKMPAVLVDKNKRASLLGFESAYYGDLTHHSW